MFLLPLSSFARMFLLIPIHKVHTNVRVEVAVTECLRAFRQLYRDVGYVDGLGTISVQQN